MPDGPKVQTVLGQVVWCTTHERPIYMCHVAITRPDFVSFGWAYCEMLNAQVVALRPLPSDDARPHRVGTYEGTD